MAELLKSYQENDLRLDLDIFQMFYDRFNELFLDLYDEYHIPYKEWGQLNELEKSKLDSSLATCNYIVDGKYAYEAYERATSSYLYFVNKNHTLIDGNKRLSIAAALIYLGINHKWLKLNWRDLHNLALEIAASEASSKDLVITETARKISDKLVPYDDELSLLNYTSGNPSWVISTNNVKENVLRGLRDMFISFFK